MTVKPRLSWGDEDLAAATAAARVVAGSGPGGLGCGHRAVLPAGGEGGGAFAHGGRASPDIFTKVGKHVIPKRLTPIQP